MITRVARGPSFPVHFAGFGGLTSILAMQPSALSPSVHVVSSK